MINNVVVRASQPARASHIPQTTVVLDSGIGGTSESMTQKHEYVGDGVYHEFLKASGYPFKFMRRFLQFIHATHHFLTDHLVPGD